MEISKGATITYSNQEVALMITDILNNSGYANLQKVDVNRNPDKIFESNETFWRDAILEKLFISQNVSFENVSLSEWIPQSPGLFYTDEAKQNRSNAEQYIVRKTDEFSRIKIKRMIRSLAVKGGLGDVDYSKYEILNELYPEGKASMIRGGIGCVRLEPKEIKNQEVFILGMTSTDIVHEGIPLICESNLRNEIIDSLKDSDRTIFSVKGEIIIMPKQISLVEYRDSIPRYGIWAKEITPIKSVKNSRLGLSLSISFLSADNNVFYSFVNIEEKDKSQLDWSIEWLKSYAVKYSETNSPSIVGDFDEIVSYFSDSKVLFPIKDIAKGKYNQEQIKFFERQFGMEFKVMNIENTEINNSGQIGVLGDNNQGEVTLNQQNILSEPINFDKLLPELTLLLTELKDKAIETDQYIAIGKVGEAEKAAKEKDSAGVLKHLKDAGSWVLETAQKIGVEVVTDLINSQIGI